MIGQLTRNTTRYKEPSKMDRIGRSLSAGAEAGIEHLINERDLEESNKAFEREGYNLRGAKNPQERQLLAQLQGQKKTQELKRQEEIKELQGKKELNDKRYNIIKSRYGEEAADIFDAAPEGGKTAIIEQLLENEQRSTGLGQKLNEVENEGRDLVEGEEKPSMRTIDYDKGLTPKERVTRQNSRYDKNLPLYQESQTKKQALEHEQDSLGTLSELSPQISGWQRLNINPTTGALIIPALASPEAQRFVKTVNDFTVNAKDSFGARVSNFELDRFMQRLPTLANSVEGREQIIKQMQIINEMNLLRNQALQDVFEEHGGIRNIDYDAAERITDKMTKTRMNELKNDFKKIDSNLDKQFQKKIESEKKIVPKDHVAVQKADGSTGYIPKKSLSKFLKVQGNKAL